MERKVIDAHSHIWTDFLWIEAPIQEYIINAVKCGIKKTLLMPVPTPIEKWEAFDQIPCLWEIKNNADINYFRKKIYSNFDEKEENPINPYEKTNKMLLQETSNLNNTQDDLIFYNVPLIHPKLDTKEYIEKLLLDKNVYALKIHGIATFCCCEDIPEDIVNILKFYGKPIIVHTDYYDADTQDIFQKLLKKNSPIEWVNFGIKNNIKVFITHAARLCKEAVELAKNSDVIMFWMWPDILLWNEKSGLYDKNIEVIERCLKNIPIHQLAFDIDYWWNLYNWNMLEKKDWWSLERLENAVNKKGISNDDIDSILYWNASRFFKI